MEMEIKRNRPAPIPRAARVLLALLWAGLALPAAAQTEGDGPILRWPDEWDDPPEGETRLTYDVSFVDGFSDLNRNNYDKRAETALRETFIPHWFVGFRANGARFNDGDLLGSYGGFRARVSRLPIGPLGLTADISYQPGTEDYNDEGDDREPFTSVAGNLVIADQIELGFGLANGYSESLIGGTARLLSLGGLFGFVPTIGFDLFGRRFTILDLNEFGTSITLNWGDSQIRGASYTQFTGLPFYSSVSVDRFVDDNLTFVQHAFNLFAIGLPIEAIPQWETTTERLTRIEAAVNFLPIAGWILGETRYASSMTTGVSRDIPGVKNGREKLAGNVNAGWFYDRMFYDPYYSLETPRETTTTGIRAVFFNLHRFTEDEWLAYNAAGGGEPLFTNRWALSQSYRFSADVGIEIERVIDPDTAEEITYGRPIFKLEFAAGTSVGLPSDRER